MTDIVYLHSRQRAKRVAQSPADYSSPITIYKRRHSATPILMAVAAVLLLAAWRM